MPRFKKKPVIVEASLISNRLRISTLEGRMVGNPGDVLITGIAGELYPCARSIFLATYDPIDAAGEDLIKQLEALEASNDSNNKKGLPLQERKADDWLPSENSEQSSREVHFLTERSGSEEDNRGSGE